jgi:hypothetical protein
LIAERDRTEPRVGSGVRSITTQIAGIFKYVTGTIIDFNLNGLLYCVHMLFKSPHTNRLRAAGKSLSTNIELDLRLISGATPCFT